MVHRVEGLVLHSQVSERLKQLQQRKALFGQALLAFMIKAPLFFHLSLELRVVVVFSGVVGPELLLELRGGERGVDRLDQLAVARANKEGVELDNAIEEVFKGVPLQVVEVLEQVVREEVDLVGIAVHLFGHYYAPY